MKSDAIHYVNVVDSNLFLCDIFSATFLLSPVSMSFTFILAACSENLLHKKIWNHYVQEIGGI